MKYLYLSITVLLIFCSCNNKDKAENIIEIKPEIKFSDFVTNFNELNFPINTNQGSWKKQNFLKAVDYNCVNFFEKNNIDKKTYTDSNAYEFKYHYFGKKTLSTKNFDIFVISKQINPNIEDLTNSYTLYTISKTGKILSTILIGELVKNADYNSYSCFSINKELEIEITTWEKFLNISDNENKNQEYLKGKISKYKINDDGIIVFLKTSNPVYENKVGELFSKIEKSSFPFTYDGNQDLKGYMVDINYHDYLKQYDFFCSKSSKCKIELILPSPENYKLFIIHSWTEGISQSHDVSVYSLTNEGAVIDRLTVAYSSSSENMSTIFTDNFEFTTLVTYCDDEDNTKQKKITETKYNIDKNGNIMLFKDQISYFEEQIEELN